MKIFVVAVAIAVICGIAHSKPDRTPSPVYDVLEALSVMRNPRSIYTRQLFTIGSCTIEEFNRKLENYPQDCKEEFSAIDLNDLINEDPNALREAWVILCRPRCGDPIVRACAECDLGELADIYIQYCSTNEAGRRCYETFDTLLPDKTAVTSNCLPRTTSFCSAACSNAITTFRVDNGCCVNIFNYSTNLYQDTVDYDLWSDCDVRTPGFCNTSTSTLSSAAELFVLIKVLIGAAFFAAVMMI